MAGEVRWFTRLRRGSLPQAGPLVGGESSISADCLLRHGFEGQGSPRAPWGRARVRVAQVPAHALTIILRKVRRQEYNI
jgi:hypothetical protein